MVINYLLSLSLIFSWCDPYKTWRDIYNFDPYKPNIDKNRIIGAIGTLWAEVISSDNLDEKVWPRATALSERLWNVNTKKNMKDLVKYLG